MGKKKHTIDDSDLSPLERKIGAAIVGESVPDALTALHVILIRVALSVSDIASVAALFRNIADEIDTTLKQSEEKLQ